MLAFFALTAAMLFCIGIGLAIGHIMTIIFGPTLLALGATFVVSPVIGWFLGQFLADLILGKQS